MHDEEGHRVDERVIRGVDPAGDSGEEGGEGESEDPIGHRRHPYRFRKVLRIAHPDDGLADPGPIDLAHDHHGDHEKDDHEIVVRGLSHVGLVEHQREQVRDLERARVGYLVDPQHAPEDRRPGVVEEQANDLAEREGDQEEVGAPQPQGGDPDRDRDGRGNDAGERQGEPEADPDELRQARRRVGADHHESGLGEGYLPGSIDEPIAQGHDTEQEYYRDVMQVELVFQQHRQRQENDGDEDADEPSHRERSQGSPSATGSGRWCR